MTVTQYGMKRLTIHNWHQPDPTIALMVGSGEEWARLFLSPQLGANVPEDIAKLFEVARGAMVYGYQFYPLFTLGFEQLIRIMETAVICRCEMLKLKPHRDNFDEHINILHKNGKITDDDAEMLQVLRHYRNEASHPKSLAILTPALANAGLKAIVAQLNSMFSETIV